MTTVDSSLGGRGPIHDPCRLQCPATNDRWGRVQRQVDSHLLSGQGELVAATLFWPRLSYSTEQKYGYNLVTMERSYFKNFSMDKCRQEISQFVKVLFFPFSFSVVLNIDNNRKTAPPSSTSTRKSRLTMRWSRLPSRSFLYRPPGQSKDEQLQLRRWRCSGCSRLWTPVWRTSLLNRCHGLSDWGDTRISALWLCGLTWGVAGCSRTAWPSYSIIQNSTELRSWISAVFGRATISRSWECSWRGIRWSRRAICSRLPLPSIIFYSKVPRQSCGSNKRG